MWCRLVICLSAMPTRTVWGLSGAGLGFLAVRAAWPGVPMGSTMLLLAVGALAAAGALVLDEAAAAAVESAPRTLRGRSATRLVALTAPLAAAAAGLGALEVREPGTPLLGLLGQTAGCIVLAVALAAFGRRHSPTPGEAVGAVVAGAVLAVGLVNPSGRWFDVFTLTGSGRWAGTIWWWSGVTVFSVFLMALGTRDPLAGHSRALRHGRHRRT